MAREMPGARGKRRISVEQSVNAVSNLIGKVPGRLLGAAMEPFVLGGKPGRGSFTATQTGAAQKAKRRAMTKGIAARTEF